MADTIDDLSRRVALLEARLHRRRRIDMSLLLLLVAMTALAAVQPSRAQQQAAEMSVERINIIGADGKPALVIANRERIDGTRRIAGLNVWDRPADLPIENVIGLLQARHSADPGVREDAERKLAALREKGRLGVHRMFFGSEDRTAAIRLMDTKGRARVRLFVDAADQARLEFLDVEGNVAHVFPPPGDAARD